MSLVIMPCRFYNADSIYQFSKRAHFNFDKAKEESEIRVVRNESNQRHFIIGGIQSDFWSFHWKAGHQFVLGQGESVKMGTVIGQNPKRCLKREVSSFDLRLTFLPQDKVTLENFDE